MATSQEVLEQLHEEAKRQTSLLLSINARQQKMAEVQAAQTPVFKELDRNLKNLIWHQEASLDMHRMIEHRQSLTSPDGNDTWRHGDQVCAGELWYGSDQIWANLASQVKLRVTSKGQLPAECDLRRGQYVAVHKYLKYHGKLCTTRVEGWSVASSSKDED